MVASVVLPLSRPTASIAAPSCRRPMAASAPKRRCATASSRPVVRRDAVIPAALAALLTLAAAVVAPERPQDQEAICQRHNRVDACRVW